MLKLFIVTFLSFVLFQLAQAASVNIISPQPNDVLKAGETVEIKWKLAKDATVDKVMIALASGPAQALLIDEVIEQGVEAKNGTYKWKIPENIKPNPK
ncbi:hypothetical protein BDA99DRAFT_432544 [Phascolomyces articulosus]|uniref:Yeast cell wall synthesis Kre9/Knh1-like N-terminal domain-containing protein n=1 Tax=Phascolomyces articulosus TaxID=60185 RepID=A0AAD5KJ39_9FUNG|nr:hypothetical protein BDA99DRAFT_432544 [Phascolomyces articulosus]